MPVYEYACKACGHEFEREQRISDPPVKKCPSCGAQKARRQISRTSFLLKGGGWYSDLYAAPKAGKGGAEAGGEAKETKPAAEKADAKAPAADAGKSDPPPKPGGKGPKAAAA